MNITMPRSGFDLRQPDLPPRWEGSTDFDKALPSNRVPEFQAVPTLAGLWSRLLAIAVSISILAVFGYLGGAAMGIW